MNIQNYEIEQDNTKVSFLNNDNKLEGKFIDTKNTEHERVY